MAHITQEPCRGAIGDLRILQQPGLETFKRFIRGDLPSPPIWRLTGMRPTEVGLGRAIFSMPVTPWLADGTGIYWGGLYALFADAPLASAIWTTLPAGKMLSTSELNMCFVRPLSSDIQNMVGRAEIVHSGGQVGLSTIQIIDQHGRTLAFGSTRCLIDNLPVSLHEKLPEPDLGPSGQPDPYLRRPPEAAFCDLKRFGELTPIELQRSTLNTDQAHPIWQLTGYRTLEIQDGYCKSTIPSSPWFSNGGFSIYSGLLAWAADFTMGSAVYSTLPAGDIFASLDIHIRFTSPAPINSGDITLNATVHHRGRQLRVCSCDIDNAEGKRVAIATSSALVIKGGARQLSEGKRPEEVIARATINRTC